MGWGLLAGYLLFSSPSHVKINDFDCRYVQTHGYTFKTAKRCRTVVRQCKKYKIYLRCVE